jgi:hypothetical protein
MRHIPEQRNFHLLLHQSETCSSEREPIGWAGGWEEEPTPQYARKRNWCSGNRRKVKAATTKTNGRNRRRLAASGGRGRQSRSGETAKPQRKRKEGQRGEMTRMTTLSSVTDDILLSVPGETDRGARAKIDLQTKQRRTEKCWPLIKWANRKEKEFFDFF